MGAGEESRPLVVGAGAVNDSMASNTWPCWKRRGFRFGAEWTSDVLRKTVDRERDLQK